MSAMQAMLPIAARLNPFNEGRVIVGMPNTQVLSKHRVHRGIITRQNGRLLDGIEQTLGNICRNYFIVVRVSTPVDRKHAGQDPGDAFWWWGLGRAA
jgi:hypothetical protein